MQIIQQITNDPNQTQSFYLPDGTSFSLTIYYVDLQYGWYITALTYGSFILNGVRVTNSPNILHQFRNQLPFGLACATKANREPTQIEDFSSGASTLYILSAAEVNAYAEYLAGSGS